VDNESFGPVSESLPIATIVTILVTVGISLVAFRDDGLREKLIFNPEAILVFKEWHRVVSSAFLHLDGNHLFWNMVTLFLFGRGVEGVFGTELFLIVYACSVVGGSLLSLWIHRHHEYRALGASGGVCGVLFAWILLFPGGSVFFLFIPVGIPGWVYALAYLAYSFLALNRGWNNVGHDAHIGGALTGILTAGIFQPAAIPASPWLFSIMLLICSAMLVYLWKNPLMLPLKEFVPSLRARTKPPRPARSGPSEDEVNAILEKVSRNGIQSLSTRERRILEQASKRQDRA